jgi:hypothetical protein
MGASMSMGRLVEDKVQCAWHGWQYDLSTGRNAFKDWACLPVYEVRVEGNDVLVAVPAPTIEKNVAARPENEEPAGDDWFVWDPDRS